MENERKSGLVLARKTHEAVVIDTPFGEIEVSVILIKRNQVRLRFEMPVSWRVRRKETEKKEYAPKWEKE